MSQYTGKAVAAAGRSDHFLAQQAAAERDSEDVAPAGAAARKAAAELRAQLLGPVSRTGAEPTTLLTGYTRQCQSATARQRQRRRYAWCVDRRGR